LALKKDGFRRHSVSPFRPIQPAFILAQLRVHRYISCNILILPSSITSSNPAWIHDSVWVYFLNLNKHISCGASPLTQLILLKYHQVATLALARILKCDTKHTFNFKRFDKEW